MDSNPRLSAALAYAARGWHVFPCVEGKKVPATKNGWIDATTDAEAIKAWWQQNPNYNVAIATGPSNLCIVDVDPGGLDGWDEIVKATPGLAELEDAFPRVDTPRGGFHYYMEGEGVTTASKLAPGVDTRGKGGYVLAPPSYVDDGKSKGGYEGEPHVETIPPVYAPLIARLVRQPKETNEPPPPPEKIAWDSVEAISRAEAWLRTLVREGKTHGTYNVCCGVMEFGLSPQKTFDLIWGLWNPHRDIPKTEEELWFRVGNAWRYGQETKGGKAPEPLGQKYEHLLPEQPETDDPRGAPPPLSPRFQPSPLAQARINLPPLEWLVDGIIPKQGIGMLYGAPESYKTFLTLDLALSVVTGVGVNWWKERREPADVLYMAAEGTHALKGKRVDSWLSKNLIPGLEYDLDRFHLIENVIPYDYRSEWEALAEWLRYYDIAPKLVVVDTHSRAMLGLDEASAGDTAKATARMEQFAKDFKCFVMAIHHTGKDQDKGARGSSALMGNMDVMYEAQRLGGDEMDTLFHIRKLKDGEKPKYPFLFKGRPYGESLAFHRDWEYVEDDHTKKKEPKPKPEPEYLLPENIARVLANGPMTQNHLADTLASHFDVSRQTVSIGLSRLKKGRLQAWCLDGTWKLPEGFTIADEEEF